MPGEIAVFDNLDRIGAWRQVDGVVGGGNQLAVDIDRGGFGAGGSGEQASGLEDRAMLEADLIAVCEKGDNQGGKDDKGKNGQNSQKAFFIGIVGHEDIIPASRPAG